MEVQYPYDEIRFSGTLELCILVRLWSSVRSSDGNYLPNLVISG